MSNAPSRMTQADVARAIRANVQTGLTHVIEIARDGTIRLVPAALRPAPTNDDTGDDTDPRLESWDA